MVVKSLCRFTLIGILSLLFFACSSTSQSDRYNKPKDESDNKSPSSVRFTSKEEKQDDTTNYRDVGSVEKPEFDEIPVEDHPVDTKELVGKYEKTENFSSAITSREKVLFEVISYLDTPYKYGGVDENGIDCSAFTQLVFRNSLAIDLPRTASQQFNEGQRISSEDDLQFGDLVFFNTTKRAYPGHVGVYLGENLFAHASRSLGVTVSSLKSTYYRTRFVGGSRVK